MVVMTGLQMAISQQQVLFFFAISANLTG